MVTIPNFVDTDEVRPGDRMTPYRAELGIGDEPVVLYAGNVGLSQSLDLLVETARRCPDVTVLINGDGAARDELERAATGIANIRFAGYVAESRLSEVLATGDIHAVPLRSGLGRVSMPSKVYSILAAGRPVVAAIDEDTEVPRLLEASGAGIAVPPRRPGSVRRRRPTPRRRSPARRPDGPRGAEVGGRRGLAGSGGDQLRVVDQDAPRRRRPRAHRHDPPVASHPRGFLIVDKKAAKLAKKGKGKKVRFQGGTLFPMVILGILVFGLATIVYARDQPAGGRRLAADGPRPLARRLRLLAVRRAGVRQAHRRSRGGGQQRPAAEHGLPAHRGAQPRRRRHPLARLDVGSGRHERHARAVPRQLRRRARRRLADVPGEPGRQGVRRGRDGVPRRRGRRARPSRSGRARRTPATAGVTCPTSTTSASTRTAS